MESFKPTPPRAPKPTPPVQPSSTVKAVASYMVRIGQEANAKSLLSQYESAAKKGGEHLVLADKYVAGLADEMRREVNSNGTYYQHRDLFTNAAGSNGISTVPPSATAAAAYITRQGGDGKAFLSAYEKSAATNPERANQVLQGHVAKIREEVQNSGSYYEYRDVMRGLDNPSQNSSSAPLVGREWQSMRQSPIVKQPELSWLDDKMNRISNAAPRFWSMVPAVLENPGGAARALGTGVMAAVETGANAVRQALTGESDGKTFDQRRDAIELDMAITSGELPRQTSPMKGVADALRTFIDKGQLPQNETKNFIDKDGSVSGEGLAQGVAQGIGDLGVVLMTGGMGRAAGAASRVAMKNAGQYAALEAAELAATKRLQQQAFIVGTAQAYAPVINAAKQAGLSPDDQQLMGALVAPMLGFLDRFGWEAGVNPTKMLELKDKALQTAMRSATGDLTKESFQTVGKNIITAYERFLAGATIRGKNLAKSAVSEGVNEGGTQQLAEKGVESLYNYTLGRGKAGEGRYDESVTGLAADMANDFLIGGLVGGIGGGTYFNANLLEPTLYREIDRAVQSGQDVNMILSGFRPTIESLGLNEQGRQQLEGNIARMVEVAGGLQGRTDLSPLARFTYYQTGQMLPQIYSQQRTIGQARRQREQATAMLAELDSQRDAQRGQAESMIPGVVSQLNTMRAMPQTPETVSRTEQLQAQLDQLNEAAQGIFTETAEVIAQRSEIARQLAQANKTLNGVTDETVAKLQRKATLLNDAARDVLENGRELNLAGPLSLIDQFSVGMPVTLQDGNTATIEAIGPDGQTATVNGIEVPTNTLKPAQPPQAPPTTQPAQAEPVSAVGVNAESGLSGLVPFAQKPLTDYKAGEQVYVATESGPQRFTLQNYDAESGAIDLVDTQGEVRQLDADDLLASGDLLGGYDPAVALKQTGQRRQQQEAEQKLVKLRDKLTDEELQALDAFSVAAIPQQIRELRANKGDKQAKLQADYLAQRLVMEGPATVTAPTPESDEKTDKRVNELPAEPAKGNSAGSAGFAGDSVTQPVVSLDKTVRYDAASGTLTVGDQAFTVPDGLEQYATTLTDGVTYATLRVVSADGRPRTLRDQRVLKQIHSVAEQQVLSSVDMDEAMLDQLLDEAADEVEASQEEGVAETLSPIGERRRQYLVGQFEQTIRNENVSLLLHVLSGPEAQSFLSEPDANSTIADIATVVEQGITMLEQQRSAMENPQTTGLSVSDAQQLGQLIDFYLVYAYDTIDTLASVEYPAPDQLPTNEQAAPTDPDSLVEAGEPQGEVTDTVTDSPTATEPLNGPELPIADGSNDDGLPEKTATAGIDGGTTTQTTTESVAEPEGYTAQPTDPTKQVGTYIGKPGAVKLKNNRGEVSVGTVLTVRDGMALVSYEVLSADKKTAPKTVQVWTKNVYLADANITETDPLLLDGEGPLLGEAAQVTPDQTVYAVVPELGGDIRSVTVLAQDGNRLIVQLPSGRTAVAYADQATAQPPAGWVDPREKYKQSRKSWGDDAATVIADDSIPAIVERMAERLKRAFPNITVEVQTDAQMGEDFGVNQNGNGPLGAFADGIVYLNAQRATLTTPLHEFAHLFGDIIAKRFPNRFKRGLQLVADTGYTQRVREMYPDLSEAEVQEEALIQAIEQMGATLMDADGNVIDSGPTTKLGQLRQWIRDSFAKIADVTGWSWLSPETTVEQWATRAAKELLAEQVITEESSSDVATDGPARLALWSANTPLPDTVDDSFFANYTVDKAQKKVLFGDKDGKGASYIKTYDTSGKVVLVKADHKADSQAISDAFIATQRAMREKVGGIGSPLATGLKAQKSTAKFLTLPTLGMWVFGKHTTGAGAMLQETLLRSRRVTADVKVRNTKFMNELYKRLRPDSKPPLSTFNNLGDPASVRRMDLPTTGGQPIKITAAEAIVLTGRYESIMADYGGFGTDATGKPIDTVTLYRPNPDNDDVPLSFMVAVADLRQIKKAVYADPDLLPILNDVYRHFDGNFDGLNQTHLMTEGIRLTKAQRYFPLRKAKTEKEIASRSVSQTIEDISPTKARRGPTTEMWVEDLAPVMERYHRQTESYIQNQVLSKNLAHLLDSHGQLLRNQNRGWLANAIESHYKSTVDPDALARSMMGNDTSAAIERNLQTMVRLSTLSRFARNISIRAKQLMGFFSAFSNGEIASNYLWQEMLTTSNHIVNPIFVVAGWANRAPIGLRQTLEKIRSNPYASTLVWRVSEEAAPDVAYANLDRVQLPDNPGAARRVVMRIWKANEKYGLAGQRIADIAVIAGIYRAAEKQVLAEQPGLSTDEQQREIARIAEHAVYYSNQTHDTTDRSAWQKSGNFLARMLGLYGGQGFKLYDSMARRNLEAALEQPGTTERERAEGLWHDAMVANIAAGAVYTAIANALIKLVRNALYNALEDDEDDKKLPTWEDAVWDTVSASVQNVPIIGNLLTNILFSFRFGDELALTPDAAEPAVKAVTATSKLLYDMTPLAQFSSQKAKQREIAKLTQQALRAIPEATGLAGQEEARLVANLVRQQLEPPRSRRRREPTKSGWGIDAE